MLKKKVFLLTVFNKKYSVIWILFITLRVGELGRRKTVINFRKWKNLVGGSARYKA